MARALEFIKSHRPKWAPAVPPALALALCRTRSGIVDWSKGAEELLGWKREEVIHQPFQELLFPPEARPRLQAMLNRLPRSRREVFSPPTRTKAGGTLQCDWQFTLLEASAEELHFSALGWPRESGIGSLELFHSLLEAVPEAALLVDSDSRILDANTPTVSTYGTCIGRFCHTFFLSQEDWRSARFCAQRGLTKEDRFTLKTTLRGSAGKAIPVEVTGSRFPLYGYVLLIIRDLSEQEEREREKRHLESRLRAMGFRLMELQHDERARIATELHDELAQKLTLLRWKVAGLQGRSVSSEELAACCQDVTRMIDGLLAEVGELVTRLRTPPLAELPFAEALERRLRFFQDAFGLPCLLATDGDMPDLQGARRSAAFYIVQEAFLNAVRHAQASEVRLSVKSGERGVLIAISDDGVGMMEGELERAMRSPGIQGMLSRAAAVGGRLAIESEKGKGTQVILILPLEPGEGR